MDSLDILDERIKEFNDDLLSQGTEADFQRTHQRIWDHINQKIVPYIGTDTESPPIHVLAYAIRAAIIPTPILSQTSQVLTIVAHVECIRLKLEEQLKEIRRIDNAIRRNVHGEQDTAEGLSEEQRSYVKDVIKTQSDLRRVYREIVNGYSLLDVYETWCSPDHTKLEGLLEMYFPFSDLWGDDLDAATLEKRHLFHHRLTDEERLALFQTAGIHLDLLRRYLKDTKKGRSPPPASSAFRAKYSINIDAQKLQEYTLWYLDEIENIVHNINAVILA